MSRVAVTIVPGTAPASVLVTTAEQAAALDRETIAAGVPSRALMQRAGAAAAGEIVRRYADRLADGVRVFAGTGNNGGDAWVVAGALARWGVRVAVSPVGGAEPTTEDGRFEFERARDRGAPGAVTGRERVVVDGIYGIGFRPRPDGGALGRALAPVAECRARGAVVVALDVPSGLDATTGDAPGGCVIADLTLTFGTLKRGLLVNRGAAGAIAVLDIGLIGDDRAGDAALVLCPRFAPDDAPPFAADAHKGTRGKLAIVGGAPGMAGAARLAADAALRSGVGMVRAVVAPESVAALQIGVPAAMTAPWAADDEGLRAPLLEWADAVLLGPGLGRSLEAGALCDRVLAAWRGPVVLDADALNHFAGRLDELARASAGRPVLLTPHPAELARLAGTTVDDVLARRFEIGREVAARTGAAVLLKGVPTVVSSTGRAVVVPAGTPVLATAGSGDVLGGIAGALMAGEALSRDPKRVPRAAPPTASELTHAAARHAVAAALAHGRAGEIAAGRRGGVRGATLDDVLDALADAWPRPGREERRPPYPVLLELPAVLG